MKMTLSMPPVEEVDKLIMLGIDRQLVKTFDYCFLDAHDERI